MHRINSIKMPGLCCSLITWHCNLPFIVAPECTINNCWKWTWQQILKLHFLLHMEELENEVCYWESYAVNSKEHNAQNVCIDAAPLHQNKYCTLLEVHWNSDNVCIQPRQIRSLLCMSIILHHFSTLKPNFFLKKTQISLSP